MKMYTQFEKQLSDILRQYLPSLNITNHRTSEETLLDYITDSLSESTLNPILNKSLKSDELAQCHLNFARELLENGEVRHAMGEIGEAIRNATDSVMVVNILLVRMVILFKCRLYHEFVADATLVKMLCPGCDIHPLFQPNFIPQSTSNYDIILRHFPPVKQFLLEDKSLRKSLDRLHHQISNGKSGRILEELGPVLRHNHQRNHQLPVIDGSLEDYGYVWDAVEISVSSERGRHVVAKRELQIGDVICVEKPSAQTVLPEMWSTHCQHCLNVCRAPLPCMTCPDVVFCSTQCLEEEKYHKVECGYMSEIRTLPKMNYLALRAIITFSEDIITQSNFSQSDIAPGTSEIFNRTTNLITNFEKRIPIDLIRRACLAIFLTNVLKQLHLFEPKSLGSEIKNYYKTARVVLLKCLQSFPCNVHEIAELEMKETFRFSANRDIGTGAFPFLSLINHSCNPNVVRHSMGTSTVLRALRKIPAGSELLDNYGYHYATHTPAERQKSLKFQYLFQCCCEACVHPAAWPLFPSVPVGVPFKCKNCEIPFTKQYPKCKKCGKKLGKVVQKVESLSVDVRKFIDLFVENPDVGLDSKCIVNFLCISEDWTSPPFKLYNECQEVLKQLWNLQSNCSPTTYLHGDSLEMDVDS